jgi:hypothetical protein
MPHACQLNPLAPQASARYQTRLHCPVKNVTGNEKDAGAAASSLYSMHHRLATAVSTGKVHIMQSKTFVSAIAATALFAATLTPAHAEGRWEHGHGRHGDHGNNGAAIVAGVLGALVIGSVIANAASAPSYAPPQVYVPPAAPAYYAAPTAYPQPPQAYYPPQTYVPAQPVAVQGGYGYGAPSQQYYGY